MATADSSAGHTTAATRVKWLPLLLAIAIGLALFFMPAQHGLTRAGQTALAITAFTIVLWAFGVMNNGVASVLMMALLIPAGAKPALALSGFSSGSWWILAGRAVLRLRDAEDRAGRAYFVLHSVVVSGVLFRDPRRVLRHRYGALAWDSFHDGANRDHGSDRLGAGAVARIEAAQQRLGAHHADHYRDGRGAWPRIAVRFSGWPGGRVGVRA